MKESKSIFFLAGDRFVSIPFDLMKDIKSKGNDLLVYLAVNSYADRETGVAWPKQKNIAIRAKRSAKVIGKAVSHLVEIGWATKIRRGQGLPNIIILHARKGQVFGKIRQKEIIKIVETKVRRIFGKISEVSF